MIKINTKSDPRISETFPNDPYSNLCIITQSQRLNLQQAFLSMDSDYFSNIDPDTREIDLRQLKQEPLIKVIHSLYGQELIVNNMSQLSEIYPIIIYLGIEDYRRTIENQVKSRKQLIQNLEFLELSYRYKILWPQVLEMHMTNKLKLLQDNKNYLQLNKLQNETFDVIILQFISRYGENQCKILNNVLQNYFNRKNIKPMIYLKNGPLCKLMGVWLKYHHVAASQLAIKSSPTIVGEQQNRSRKRTQALSRRQQESVESKRKKVIDLEKEIYFKDNIITQLTDQIQQLRKELGIKSQLAKPITARSMLIDLDSGNNPNMHKNRRLEEISPETQSDNDTTITEQNYPNHGNNHATNHGPTHVSSSKRLTPEIKDFKMNRFGSKNFKKS